MKYVHLKLKNETPGRRSVTIAENDVLSDMSCYSDDVLDTIELI